MGKKQSGRVPNYASCDAQRGLRVVLRNVRADVFEF
jgi:hypothetical protein